jgi:cytochrome c oxidase subunit IV
MAEHVIAKRVYFGVFAALISLTILTTAVAYVDLGGMNTVAALVIAVCKGSLVVLFFMHLKYQPGLTRVTLLAALLWLVILIGLTTGDVFTRHWSPTGQPWGQATMTRAGR